MEPNNCAATSIRNAHGVTLRALSYSAYPGQARAADLLARGTEAQLEGLEKELNTRLLPRTQLVIEARWAEMPALQPDFLARLRKTVANNSGYRKS